jgi:hypothetical protein
LIKLSSVSCVDKGCGTESVSLGQTFGPEPLSESNPEGAAFIRQGETSLYLPPGRVGIATAWSQERRVPAEQALDHFAFARISACHCQP